jgi:hypothetical protein
MLRYSDLCDVGDLLYAFEETNLPLHWNSANGSDFLVSDCNGQTHLASHTGATNNGFPQAQLLDEGGYNADIAILGVRMRAWEILLRREAPSVPRQIESVHGTSRAHPRIVHHTMVLSTVATCRVEEDNGLLAFTRVLVENLGFTPHWGLEEYVFARQVVLYRFWLRVLLHWSAMRVVRKLENAAPDMRPVREMRLVALYLDAFLLDVHAEHAPVALVRRDWDILEELFPLIWESGKREEGILRRAGFSLRGAVVDFDEDRVVRAAGFDTEGCRLVNCIGGRECF